MKRFWGREEDARENGIAWPEPERLPCRAVHVVRHALARVFGEKSLLDEAETRQLESRGADDVLHQQIVIVKALEEDRLAIGCVALVSVAGDVIGEVCAREGDGDDRDTTRRKNARDLADGRQFAAVLGGD